MQPLTGPQGKPVGEPRLLKAANLEERVVGSGARFHPGVTVVLQNLVSRPELNGCLAKVGGGAMFTQYASVTISRTGESVRCKPRYLLPLAEAPEAILCDLDDLALDEHPVEASAMAFHRLGRDEPVYVRVHGLTSQAGQAINGCSGFVKKLAENDRLGVLLDATGELKSVSCKNLLHARRTTDALVHRGTHAPGFGRGGAHNERSRAAGDFDTAAVGEAQRGFYVYYPGLRRGGASGHEPAWDGGLGAAQCWPGVYTDKRMQGVRTAPASDVVSCSSWADAWARWRDLLDDDRPFVVPLRAVTPPRLEPTASGLCHRANAAAPRTNGLWAVPSCWFVASSA